MEEIQENHDKTNTNIQLEQLIFQQKREKLKLLNKIKLIGKIVENVKFLGRIIQKRN
ncbi:unnamed protein product [Paramecium primaurelia]|uniref:Uncharacterized protein n=1 Tax=Paramecium primaurelia TaxID=5886 RepID=A0A8S1Q6H4_PARPR|nr:unnamed protein product [Paramecium primaurelia]